MLRSGEVLWGKSVPCFYVITADFYAKLCCELSPHVTRLLPCPVGPGVASQVAICVLKQRNVACTVLRLLRRCAAMFLCLLKKECL